MGFELKDRWAVVTGASAGIGKCLAIELAKRGCHLVLVARRRERLEELANTLKAEYRISAEVFPEDLTGENAAGLLAAAVAEWPISILVNNAGFAQSGPFENGDWEKLQSMIQLNVVFLTAFTHAMLPRLKMAENGARILNVGSLAGYMGVPMMSCYSATKAFVNHFSEGLAWELRGTKVRVTSLEPGSTRSEFFEVAGMSKSLMSRINVMRAEKVAKQGVRVLIRGRRRWVAGVLNKLGVFALRLSPRWLVGVVVKHLFKDLDQPT